ncbi:MAG TPA: serine/threonine-protein kinase [Bryobacteraceae bacterium]|nr:serine/threonine-protein kinase [Bryobacteraceae bacterium]
MIGTTVSHYHIIEEIGHGAMGRVFKARDTHSGRFAALKVVAEKYLENVEILKRFEREGLAISSLKHPHICNVYEIGAWQNQPFIAMELLRGETVRDRLRRKELFAEDACFEIARQISGALEAAHGAGILHRDIKPANIFLDQEGNTKLLDFGMAKIKKPQPARALAASAATMATVAMSFATIPGTIVGTIAYMAPEQAKGLTVDARADLYSLGVVLHEMASGELPLGGMPRAARLPARLVPILTRLIAADPAARYQSAGELRAVLAR